MNPNPSVPRHFLPDASKRRPYTTPRLRFLGRMSDRTLGTGGSNADMGQMNNTKMGVG
jgi:hypothetical protein